LNEAGQKNYRDMFQVLRAGFVPPCLPANARTVPNGLRWAYEIKHDASGSCAGAMPDGVRVLSRHSRALLRTPLKRIQNEEATPTAPPTSAIVRPHNHRPTTGAGTTATAGAYTS
jgi:hypothetical protein